MYCHDWEEYSENKGKMAKISIPNYTLQNYEEKRVVLKSRGTKRNDNDTNHRKKKKWASKFDRWICRLET